MRASSRKRAIQSFRPLSLKAARIQDAQVSWTLDISWEDVQVFTYIQKSWRRQRGIRGSADPPQILNLQRKSLKLSIPIPLSQEPGILIPLCEIPNVASGYIPTISILGCVIKVHRTRKFQNFKSIFWLKTKPILVDVEISFLLGAKNLNFWLHRFLPHVPKSCLTFSKFNRLVA